MTGSDLQELVLDRISRVRRARPRLTDERITMAHGAGGKASRALVESVFLDAFSNPALSALDDQAVLPLGNQHLAFSTDSFVVSPLFFPGGCIGDLAVNGTVNDVAMAGARPLYLSTAFVLEEGFPVSDLRRITGAMSEAAAAAGVAVVTGDTKVVPRGTADGCYISTSGVGIVQRPLPGPAALEPGDVILLSGPIGDHGTTILLARGQIDLEAELASDTAPLTDLVQALLAAAPDVRCLRDATRGGVATVLNEWADAGQTSITVDESLVPVRDEVRGACELLGIDPLYVACEGRFVSAVPPSQAPAALEALNACQGGEQATAVGSVGSGPEGTVLLRTSFGGTRVVDMLVGDPLPRIC